MDHTPAAPEPARKRLQTSLLCVISGLLIAAALPPWGWWPCVFVGLALLDHLLANSSAKQRFRRTGLVTIAWLAPGMLWMLDLTPPGYLIAVGLYAGLFGLAAAVTPPSRWRRLAFPAAMTVATLVMWRLPFGGVPLATLPMTQAQSPLLPIARIAGSIGLVAVVVAIGFGVAALAERHYTSAFASGIFVAALSLLAAVAPTGGDPVDSLDIAVVQGGGIQRTRASPEGAQVVFDRHIEASAMVNPGVDLVLWPENVVNPTSFDEGDNPIDRLLYREEAIADLAALAARLDAPLLAGWFEAISPTETANYTDVLLPDGTIVDRYDKVQIVPFGEFVPLRPLLNIFAEDVLPPRDVVRGTGPAVLDTPVGKLGISISWEVFFERRARDAITNGGQILLNPTNGSSYWLTILQTQQLASSRLRAVETGRYVVQAAPTGFSAIVSPEGDVLTRADIGEQKVIHGTVELYDELTWAMRLGPLPVLLAALAVLAAGIAGHERNLAKARSTA